MPVGPHPLQAGLLRGHIAEKLPGWSLAESFHPKWNQICWFWETCAPPRLYHSPFLAETPGRITVRLVTLVDSESPWLCSWPAASAKYTRYPLGLGNMRTPAFAPLSVFGRNAGWVCCVTCCSCCQQICVTALSACGLDQAHLVPIGSGKPAPLHIWPTSAFWQKRRADSPCGSSLLSPTNCLTTLSACGLDHIQPETHRVWKTSALLLLLPAEALQRAHCRKLPG